MPRSRIIGTGSYLPARVVGNEEVGRWLSLDSAAIHRRTGIRTRHWATEDEPPSVLAEHAAVLRDAYDGLKGVRLIQTFGKHPVGQPSDSPRCECGGELAYVDSVCMPPDAEYWWESSV